MSHWWNIDTIKLINGKKEFTSSLCDEKGETVQYIPGGLEGLEVVSNDAFYNCTKLNQLYLNSNRIGHLDPEQFMYNNLLKILDLSCNRLNVIPEALFKPLNNLQQLNLGGNSIKSIDPVLQSNLISLTNFGITGTSVNDLNVKELNEKLPQLKKMAFRNIPIECGRYKELEKQLTAKNIINAEGAKTCETQNKMFCLSNQEWSLKYLHVDELLRKVADSAIETKLGELEGKLDVQLKEVSKKIEETNASRMHLDTMARWSLGLYSAMLGCLIVALAYWVQKKIWKRF